MRRFKQTAILMLAALMLAAPLAACNKTTDDPSNSGDPNESSTASGYVYVADYYPIPEGYENLYRLSYHEGKLYFTQDTYDESLNPWVGEDGESSGSDLEPMPFEGARDGDTADEAADSTDDTADSDAESDGTDDAADVSTDTAVSASGSSTAAAASAPTSAPSTEADSIKPVAVDMDKYQAYENSRRTRMYRINIDGSGLEELTEYDPPALAEGEQGSVYTQSITIAPDGTIWTCENYDYYHYDDESYVSDGMKAVLRKLDSNGADTGMSFDLNSIMTNTDYYYVNYTAVDDDGNLYLNNETVIYVIDPEGKLLFTVETDNWFNGLFTLGDGRVAAAAYGQNGQELKIIDTAAKGWGETMPIPRNVYSYYRGDSDYAFFYSDSANFYGYDLAAQEGVKLFNWIGIDVDNSYINEMISTPDGKLVTLYNNYESDEMRTEILVLTKKPAAEVPNKTLLTMATLWMDYEIRREVINFNKTNPNYRIEVNSYDEYNTEEDWQAGMNKLTTEILSGKVPDLICVNGLPIQQYIKKGVLEDLYPWIDNDPELGRDKLVEGVTKLLEFNGKLYQASNSFNVMTFVGRSDIVGDKLGWTIDEMNAALAKLPEGAQAFNMLTKDSIIMYSCYFALDQFVDWETGRCNFDSDGFIKLLEFANTFPLEIDYEAYYSNREEIVSEDELVRQGKLLLMNYYAYDFTEIQRYRAVFGGDITFVGFPTESGTGSALNISSGLAMSATCKDKEGAWQFMRTLLTSEYQTAESRYRWGGFPTNKEALNKKIADALDPEKASEYEYTIGFGDGSSYEIKAPTQADVDKILELINNASSLMNYDENIMTIINEETAAYFNGQKNARDTANVIQSRVQIYVSEQS